MIWGFPHDLKPLHLTSCIDCFQCFLMGGRGSRYCFYASL